MNKYLIACICAGISLLSYYYFSHNTAHLDFDTTNQHTVSAENKFTSTGSSQNRSIQRISSDKHLSQAPSTDIPRLTTSGSAMDEETSIRLRRESMIDGAGYSEEGAKAFERGESIALKDMPESLKDIYQKELDDLKRDGHLKISEDDMSDIIEVTSHLIGKRVKKLKI